MFCAFVLLCVCVMLLVALCFDFIVFMLLPFCASALLCIWDLCFCFLDIYFVLRFSSFFFVFCTVYFLLFAFVRVREGKVVGSSGLFCCSFLF